MNSTIVRPGTSSDESVEVKAGMASPLAAAAFLAGIVYCWLEAAFRLAFTYFPNFNSAYFLWNGRPGDVVAMWITIMGLEVVVFLAFARIWRGRPSVGSIQLWTTVLIISAIAAPIIGEIGQTVGI